MGHSHDNTEVGGDAQRTRVSHAAEEVTLYVAEDVKSKHITEKEIGTYRTIRDSYRQDIENSTLSFF